MSARDFEWLRSSYCATGACVEARRVGAVVLVQDSKVPASGGGEMQAWSLPEWSGLLAAIKAGAHHSAVDPLPDGGVWLGFQDTGRHEILGFTADEWDAFVAGVRAGEFDIDKLSGPAASEGVGAGRVGSDSAAGADRAATGAGAAGNPPAPVAAVFGPSPVKPCPMSGASSGHDAGLLTDGESVLPGAAHTHFSGPNVASMNVPAGRPSPAPHQVIPPQEAGQPGPFATNTDVDLVRPDFLTGVDVEEWAREWAEAAWAVGFAAGRQATTSEIDVAREWAKRTAPLVPEVIEASRSDADSEPGGVPTHVGAATGGWKAGPGLTPVSPGPAEPTGGAA